MANLKDTQIDGELVVGDRNVMDEIDTLNSNLKTRIEYFTLLANVTATTEQITHVLYNNRKFSDYDLVCFHCQIGNEFRNCVVIPSSTWRTGNFSAEIDFQTSGVAQWLKFYPISDNEVAVKTGCTTTTIKSVIVGYKLT